MPLMALPAQPHGYLATGCCIYSFWMLRWMRPDMARTVRIGLNGINLEQSIYGGIVIFLFSSTCIIAPMCQRRHAAMLGNGVMAFSSMLIIVNHWLIEKKWVWGGLLYIMNIWFFCGGCGLMTMGQFSRYRYTWNRVKDMIVPIGSCLFLLYLLVFHIFEEKTIYDDLTPAISIVVHTIMAIIAEKAAPRSACWNFMLTFQRQVEGRYN